MSSCGTLRNGAQMVGSMLDEEKLEGKELPNRTRLKKRTDASQMNTVSIGFKKDNSESSRLSSSLQSTITVYYFKMAVPPHTGAQNGGKL